MVNNIRLGYDIQPFFTGSRRGGIGRYCYQFLKNMLELYPENSYVLFNNAEYDQEKPFPSKENIVYKTIKYSNGYDHNPINGLIQYINYNLESMDLITVLSPIEFKLDSVISHRLLENKSILLLYDVIPLVFSNLYLTSRTAKEEYIDRIKIYQKADMIFSISQNSKIDAENYLNILSNKIVNIGLAASPNFFKINELDLCEIQRIHRKFGIEDNFLLYVGSLDVRKNVGRLIEAHKLMPDSLRRKHPLYIVTSSSPRLASIIIKQLSIGNDNKVKFIFNVDDEELNFLYNICDLFIFPSLYEGGGLPVLEAMKCGAPVIASNNSSIPEISGRVDNLFDAEDVGSIYKLIMRVLGNKEYSNELRDFGLKREKEFTWDRVVNTAMDSYQSHISDCKLKGKQKLLNNKEKIGFLTTWNTKCGIANYSNYLLNEIGNKDFEVYVLTNIDCLKNEPDAPNIKRCWTRGKKLDALLEEISKLQLQMVLIQYNRSFFSIDSLASLILILKRMKLKVVVTVHDTLSNNDQTDSLQRIAFELKCADSILVFSAKDINKLSSWGISNNTFLVGQGTLDYKDQNRETIRKIKGIDNSKIIASYGFLLPHKGILEVIESLPDVKKIFPDILYLIVCSLYPHNISQEYFKKCKSKVEELQLSENVSFVTDYLSDNQSIDYLHLSDLIILPYHDSEQPTSAALRFALSAKRPIVTTDYSIFEDHEECIYKIPRCEPQLIAEAIIKIYQNESIYFEKTELIKKRCKLDSWENESKKYLKIIYEILENEKDTEYKWVKLIEEVSEELSMIKNTNIHKAVTALSNEIYGLRKQSQKY